MGNPIETALLDATNFPIFPFNPNNLHTFKDKFLERQVFTHSSASSQSNAWLSTPSSCDNEHLEWLGDAVLKGLTGHLLDTLFPEMDEGHLSLLMTALVNNRFYAHLARTLGLVRRLRIADGTNAPLQSDRVLGGLFEAYIGGMHREIGSPGDRRLYVWFRALMEPYAVAFFKRMQGVEAQEAAKMGGETAIENFTGWLHAFAQVNRLPPPQFRYQKVGEDHLSMWLCTVFLGEAGFVEGSGAPTKAAAKETACERAVGVVRQRWTRT